MVIRLFIDPSLGLTPDDVLARATELSPCHTTLLDSGKHFHDDLRIVDLSLDNDESWRDDAITMDFSRAFGKVQLLKRSPKSIPAPIPVQPFFQRPTVYRHRVA